MSTICSAAVFAVVAAYCVLRAVREARRRRERLLRRRLAYMLWVMAAMDESPSQWYLSWGSADH